MNNRHIVVLPLLFASALQAMLQPCSYSSAGSDDVTSRQRQARRSEIFASLRQPSPAAQPIQNNIPAQNTVNLTPVERALAERIAQTQRAIERNQERMSRISDFAVFTRNYVENQTDTFQNQQQQQTQAIAAVQLQAQAAGNFAAEQAAEQQFMLEQERQRGEQLQKQLQEARTRLAAVETGNAYQKSWLTWLTGGTIVGATALTAGLVYLWKNSSINPYSTPPHNTAATNNSSAPSSPKNTPPPPPSKPAAQLSHNSHTPPPPPPAKPASSSCFTIPFPSSAIPASCFARISNNTNTQTPAAPPPPPAKPAAPMTGPAPQQPQAHHHGRHHHHHHHRHH